MTGRKLSACSTRSHEVCEDDTKRIGDVRRSLLLAPRSAVGWAQSGAAESTARIPTVFSTAPDCAHPYAGSRVPGPASPAARCSRTRRSGIPRGRRRGQRQPPVCWYWRWPFCRPHLREQLPCKHRWTTSYSTAWTSRRGPRGPRRRSEWPRRPDLDLGNKAPRNRQRAVAETPRSATGPRGLPIAVHVASAHRMSHTSSRHLRRALLPTSRGA